MEISLEILYVGIGSQKAMHLFFSVAFPIVP